MTKSEHITYIQTFTKDTADIFKFAGIKPSALEIKIPLTEEIDAIILEEAYKWLKYIDTEVIAKIRPIFKLAPLDQWLNYKRVPENKNLREMRLIEQPISNLRTIIFSTKRPILFTVKQLKKVVK